MKCYPIIQEAYGSHIHIFESKIPTSVKVGEVNMSEKKLMSIADMFGENTE